MGISLPLTWELIKDLASQKSLSFTTILSRDFLDRGLTDRILLLICVWVPNIVTLSIIIPFQLADKIPMLTQLRYVALALIFGVYLSQIGGKTFNTIPFLGLMFSVYTNFSLKAFAAMTTSNSFLNFITVTTVADITLFIYLAYELFRYLKEKQFCNMTKNDIRGSILFISLFFSNIFIFTIRMIFGAVVNQNSSSQELIAHLCCACFFTLAISSMSSRVMRYEMFKTTVSHT